MGKKKTKEPETPSKDEVSCSLSSYFKEIHRKLKRFKFFIYFSLILLVCRASVIKACALIQSN
jgi:hypothetical protein